MDFQSKINQLRSKIYSTLSPLINNDYILLEVPYYPNIGDVLIWEGERSFLKSLPYKGARSSSSRSWNDGKIPSDKIILLQGGGNFGDLYRIAQDFRLKIIQNYPNNRIVMFPQSVWYEDKSLIDSDYKLMRCHKDLHLCARDKKSYDFLKKNFSKCNIYLVPDMAFFIDEEILRPCRNKVSDNTLFFKRLDKEISHQTPESLCVKSDIHDWPTFEKPYRRFYIFDKSLNIMPHITPPWFRNLIGVMIDKSADVFIRKSLTKIGVNFIKQYDNIIATRLHAMILSILLYRNVWYIDNTNGKLSAFVNTWLQDMDGIQEYPI